MLWSPYISVLSLIAFPWHSEATTWAACSAGERRCGDGRCVLPHDVCTGNGCPVVSPYRCGPRGICYTEFLRCNYIVDCEDGEDEEGCNGEEIPNSAWYSVLGLAGIVALIILDTYFRRRAKSKYSPTSSEPQSVAPAALAGAPCSSVTVNVHGDVNSIPHAEVAITNQRIVSSSNRPRMSTTDESVPLTAALEGVVDSDLPSYEDAVNYSPQTGIAIDYPPPPYEAVARGDTSRT